MSFRPYATFDPAADAIYVYLLDAPVARSKVLDDLRNVDYSADGGVVGVEFLGVSGGVDLSDVPYRQRVEQAIKDKGISVQTFA